MVLSSALNSISDPILYYLASSVLIISGLVLLMLLQVVGFRIYSVYQDCVTQKAKQIWRPIMASAMLLYPENIPSLEKKHKHILLREWNIFYSKLRGDAQFRLQILAHHKCLDLLAHRYINSSSMRKKLQGIITLGHMKDSSAWDELTDFVLSKHSILSLTAAQALVNIDSKKALHFLLPHIIKRRDWPAARVAMLHASTNPSELSVMLKEAINQSSEEEIPYILQFMGSNHFDAETFNIYQQLGNSNDSKIIAACIHAAQDVRGLEVIRKHVSNPEWYIRLNVASTLGRIGTKDDIKILIKLMGDSEWWVRYRSAQALVEMPFIDNNELEKIYSQLDDRYARDMLKHVIAEQQWN